MDCVRESGSGVSEEACRIWSIRGGFLKEWHSKQAPEQDEDLAGCWEGHSRERKRCKWILMHGLARIGVALLLARSTAGM